MYNIEDYLKLLEQDSPNIIALDTETTGLDILLDSPFMVQLGHYNEERNEYVTVIAYEADMTRLVEAVFDYIYRSKARLIGHNLTFDLHMLANKGLHFKSNKVSDTASMIRLAHDAINTRYGGVPLGLKEYTTRYIDPKAKDHEGALNLEKKHLTKKYNDLLKTELRNLDRSWTLAKLNNILKDKVSRPEELLNEKEFKIYSNWKENLIPPRIAETMTGITVDSSEIPYDILNHTVMAQYGHYDIVYTLKVYYKTLAAIKARGQLEGLSIESRLIMPVFRMERVGFTINVDYVKESNERMRNYILSRREALIRLAGEPITVSQSKRIAEIFQEKYNYNLPSTGKEVLDELHSQLEEGNIKEFIETIQELRTLEKWYSTYLTKFLKQAEVSDQLHTTLFSAGAVTGRFTSDFQQFPNYGIKDRHNTPLFNPRQMIKTSEGYRYLVYLDYSQIELRVQAVYTILLGSPDLNLCRAYMPYKCYSGDTVFDYNDRELLAQSYTRDWYREEDDSLWIKTDVHGATTSVAFPDVDVESEEFQQLREIGKRVNFAKNYGAQFAKIRTMFPDLDEETVKRVDEAYYKAFPGVKKYHEYCYNVASQGVATNMFGVKYYGMSGHKLQNALIQGSAAYLLKVKIIELDEYIQKNNLKSKMQMTIHDEISFLIHEDEKHHVRELLHIMQDFPKMPIPIVADFEVSTTTWAEKIRGATLEEFEAGAYD